MCISVLFVPASIEVPGVDSYCFTISLNRIESGLTMAIEKVRENTNYPEDWDALENAIDDVWDKYQDVLKYYDTGTKILVYLVKTKDLINISNHEVSFSKNVCISLDTFKLMLDTYVISEACANSYQPEDWNSCYEEIIRVSNGIKEGVNHLNKKGA